MSPELSINKSFRQIWIGLFLLMAIAYSAIVLPGQKTMELQRELQKKTNLLSQTENLFQSTNEELARLSNVFRESGFYQSELECLADNIYYESRGEPAEGQLAVATVTMNRVHSSKFPNTVCDVVYQRSFIPKNEKWMCQFSWTCETVAKPNKIAYNNVRKLAEMVMYQNYRSALVAESLYFHATYIDPNSWFKSKKMVGSVGKHVFYKDQQ